MAISETHVRHVAKLARLKLTDEQITQFARQLGDILAYVEKLDALDTTHVQPTAHAAAITNVFREDQPRPGIGSDAVLKNAPDSAPPFFKVPKVLEQSDF